jgi:hypothetical protein
LSVISRQFSAYSGVAYLLHVTLIYTIMGGGFGNPSGPGGCTLWLLSRGEVKVSVMWLVNRLAMLCATSTLTFWHWNLAFKF